MSAYFDVTVPAHLEKLPTIIRTDADIAFVAMEAEADVIAHYRRQYTDSAGIVGTRVCLVGYTEDADDCLNQQLKDALCAEIAAIIAYRYKLGLTPTNAFGLGEQLAISEVKHDRRSYKMRNAVDVGLAGNDDVSMPKNFPKFLRPFECIDCLSTLMYIA